MQSKTTQVKSGFGSKLGFILAAAGSAVGLGNIWRFPYETGQNGGAAFLLVYILCVLFCGYVWFCLDGHRDCHWTAYRKKCRTGIFRYELSFQTAWLASRSDSGNYPSLLLCDRRLGAEISGDIYNWFWSKCSR